MVLKGISQWINFIKIKTRLIYTLFIFINFGDGDGDGGGGGDGGGVGIAKSFAVKFIFLT